LRLFGAVVKGKLFGVYTGGTVGSRVCLSGACEYQGSGTVQVVVVESVYMCDFGAVPMCGCAHGHLHRCYEVWHVCLCVYGDHWYWEQFGW